MDNLRRVAAPGYLVAAMMIAFPLVDLVLASWPIVPGEVAWRFGAAGLLSRELALPMLGLLLAFVLALLLEQRKLVRMLAILSGVLVLVTLGTMLLFALDAVQIRAQFSNQAKNAAAAASLVALAKYSGAALVLLVITVNGWKASRPRGRHERKVAAGELIRPGAGATRNATPAGSAAGPVS